LGAKRAAESLVVEGWRRFFIWSDKPSCRIKRTARMPRTGVAARIQQGMNARVASADSRSLFVNGQISFIETAQIGLENVEA